MTSVSVSARLSFAVRTGRAARRVDADLDVLERTEVVEVALGVHQRVVAVPVAGIEAKQAAHNGRVDLRRTARLRRARDTNRPDARAYAGRDLQSHLGPVVGQMRLELRIDLRVRITGVVEAREDRRFVGHHLEPSDPFTDSEL
jgi:hypothetical protein